MFPCRITSVGNMICMKIYMAAYPPRMSCSNRIACLGINNIGCLLSNNHLFSCFMLTNVSNVTSIWGICVTLTFVVSNFTKGNKAHFPKCRHVWKLRSCEELADGYVI